MVRRKTVEMTAVKEKNFLENLIHLTANEDMVVAVTAYFQGIDLGLGSG